MECVSLAAGLFGALLASQERDFGLVFIDGGGGIVISLCSTASHALGTTLHLFVAN